jgi:hypothetical protein
MASELSQARLRAKRLTMKFNNYLPDDATPESLSSEREKILRKLLGRLGVACYVEPPLHVDYGCNVSIGDWTYANTGYVPCHPYYYIILAHIYSLKSHNPRLRPCEHRIPRHPRSFSKHLCLNSRNRSAIPASNDRIRARSYYRK